MSDQVHASVSIDPSNVPKRNFTVLSLFSGGMGLDIGLEQTGAYKLLACIEKVTAFCDTIRRNRDFGRLANASVKVYESDTNKLAIVEVPNDLGLTPGAAA